METSAEGGAHLTGTEPESFPALCRLGLGPAELVALRRKGYVAQDDRGHGHDGYWRLRFRLGGRARTVYLGRDPQLVEAVRNELSLLQQQHHQERRIAKVTSEGKKVLRAAKRRLGPVLRQLGYRYHGDAMRKQRGDKNVVR